MIDLSRFRICSTCQEPYGTEPQDGFPTPQRCSCDRRRDPRWPRFDFNEHVHLCRCCRSYTLASGSRWSVWFCDACKGRVRLFNHGMGRTVIPIGRHSLMAGVGIEGVALAQTDRAEIDRLVARFSDDMQSLVGAMTGLADAARQRSIAMREPLGYSPIERPRLDDWLTRAGKAATRGPELGVDAAFRSLLVELSR